MSLFIIFIGFLKTRAFNFINFNSKRMLVGYLNQPMQSNRSPLLKGGWGLEAFNKFIS